jgi:hypothetical protein
MRCLLVTLGVLAAVGAAVAVPPFLAATVGSAGHSRPEARASASAAPDGIPMCDSDCQSDKLEPAAPELPPHPQGTGTGNPIVIGDPPANLVRSLSVGASMPFSINLDCPLPGFLLNGKTWIAGSSVHTMPGYWKGSMVGFWYGTLRLNSGSSATFRDSAGDDVGFAPGPANACPS